MRTKTDLINALTITLVDALQRNDHVKAMQCHNLLKLIQGGK